MGNAESSSSGETSASHIGTAFHVLRVAEGSPAADAGIDPFFDFLCGINGVPLTEEIEDLTQVIEKSEGTALVLQIWSTKRRESRNVRLIPSRSWALGASTSNNNSSATPSLLGLSLRLCDPKHALEQVWHVLEILEGSPAQSAGLVPLGDWIVGYAGGVLRGEGDFYDIVEEHVDKPLRLFVYNADYDITREAILVPNRSWGGEGLLGCGVGYGLLHRIPKPQDRKLPLDLEFQDQNLNQNQNNVGGEGGGRFEVEEEEERYNQSNEFDLRNNTGTGTGGGGNNRNRREDSEGYEEVSYEGEFDSSEGVQVIASSPSFNDYNNSTSPPPPPTSSSLASSGGGMRGSSPSYRPPPVSPNAFSSTSRFGVEQIQEEEE